VVAGFIFVTGGHTLVSISSPEVFKASTPSQPIATDGTHHHPTLSQPSVHSETPEKDSVRLTF